MGGDDGRADFFGNSIMVALKSGSSCSCCAIEGFIGEPQLGQNAFSSLTDALHLRQLAIDLIPLPQHSDAHIVSGAGEIYRRADCVRISGKFQLEPCS
jgi:hypothetical protein